MQYFAMSGHQGAARACSTYSSRRRTEASGSSICSLLHAVIGRAMAAISNGVSPSGVAFLAPRGRCARHGPLGIGADQMTGKCSQLTLGSIAMGERKHLNGLSSCE